MSLCALGDVVWDVLAKPHTPLRPAGDTTGQVLLMGGGSVANVAVWCARTGYPSQFVGKVGQDRLGELAIESLQTEGIESHIIADPQQTTGVVLALVDPSGERSMLSGQGADFALYPSELPQTVIQNAKHLHLSGWSVFSDPPRSASLQATQWAHQAGIPISFDTGSYQMIDQMGREAFLAIMHQLAPSMLFPNRQEAMVLSQRQQPAQMLNWFRQQFPDSLIALKLDREGVLLAPAGQTPRLILASHVTALDATGAGDAFAGSFLGHYLAGQDVWQAAERAVRVAAWVIQQLGARPALNATYAQWLENA